MYATIVGTLISFGSLYYVVAVPRGGDTEGDGRRDQGGAVG